MAQQPTFRPYTGGIQPVQGQIEAGARIGQAYQQGLTNLGAGLAEGIKEYYKNSALNDQAAAEAEGAAGNLTRMMAMLGQSPEYAPFVAQYSPLLEKAKKAPTMGMSQRLALANELKVATQNLGTDMQMYNIGVQSRARNLASEQARALEGATVDAETREVKLGIVLDSSKNTTSQLNAYREKYNKLNEATGGKAGTWFQFLKKQQGGIEASIDAIPDEYFKQYDPNVDPKIARERMKADVKDYIGNEEKVYVQAREAFKDVTAGSLMSGLARAGVQAGALLFGNKEQAQGASSYFSGLGKRVGEISAMAQEADKRTMEMGEAMAPLAAALPQSSSTKGTAQPVNKTIEVERGKINAPSPTVQRNADGYAISVPESASGAFSVLSSWSDRTESVLEGTPLEGVYKRPSSTRFYGNVSELKDSATVMQSSFEDFYARAQAMQTGAERTLRELEESVADGSIKTKYLQATKVAFGKGEIYTLVDAKDLGPRMANKPILDNRKKVEEVRATLQEQLKGIQTGINAFNVRASELQFPNAQATLRTPEIGRGNWVERKSLPSATAKTASVAGQKTESQGTSTANTTTQPRLVPSFGVASAVVGKETIKVQMGTAQKKQIVADYVKKQMGFDSATIDSVVANMFPSDGPNVRTVQTAQGMATFVQNEKGGWNQVTGFSTGEKSWGMFGTMTTDGKVAPKTIQSANGTVQVRLAGQFQGPDSAFVKFNDGMVSYLDGMEAAKRLQEIAKLGAGPMFDRAMAAEAEGLVARIKAAVRTEVVGTGSISDYEQKLLDSIIYNPATFWSLSSANQARILGVMDKMNSHLVNQGRVWGVNISTNLQSNSERETQLRMGATGQ